MSIDPSTKSHGWEKIVALHFKLTVYILPQFVTVCKVVPGVAHLILRINLVSSCKIALDKIWAHALPRSRPLVLVICVNFRPPTSPTPHSAACAHCKKCKLLSETQDSGLMLPGVFHSIWKRSIGSGTWTWERNYLALSCFYPEWVQANSWRTRPKSRGKILVWLTNIQYDPIWNCHNKSPFTTNIHNNFFFNSQDHLNC
jgi:hypothetical protein